MRGTGVESGDDLLAGDEGDDERDDLHESNRAGAPGRRDDWWIMTPGVEALTVGDYDERDRRIRLGRATTKTRRALWVELPDVLADAIEATLPPREDRDAAAPLFADVGADRLRMAIARACRAAGVPTFMPHDLRHRRISLLHRQGRTWAQIGALVGQRKLSVTSDTCTHVLPADDREVELGRLLGDA